MVRLKYLGVSEKTRWQYVFDLLTNKQNHRLAPSLRLLRLLREKHQQVYATYGVLRYCKTTKWYGSTKKSANI